MEQMIENFYLRNKEEIKSIYEYYFFLFFFQTVWVVDKYIDDKNKSYKKMY